MTQQQQQTYQADQEDIHNQQNQRARPGRFDIFLHAIKTFKLIGGLLTDRRIPFLRKIVFLGAIVFLLLILVFPDVFNEFFLSTVFPLVGTVLGVPIDAGFDWIAFSFVIVSLLRIFPADIMAEHYKQVFQ